MVTRPNILELDYRIFCRKLNFSNDQNYVLSAAHCFQRSNNPDLVRLGDLDINTNNEASHEDFPIQRVINHPE